MGDDVLVEVEFEYLKSTQRTFRFTEIVPQGREPKIGDIYLKQSVFPDGYKPKKESRIKVTVELTADGA